MRIIVDNGRDTQAPLQYSEGPFPVSGRTFKYTINPFVVGSEVLRLSDVATVCAGLVILLRQGGVGLLTFEVARDGAPSPVMTGALYGSPRAGAGDVAVN